MLVRGRGDADAVVEEPRVGDDVAHRRQQRAPCAPETQRLGLCTQGPGQRGGGHV